MHLEFVTEKLDDTPKGRLLASELSSVAAVERDLIRERTQAGLVAARARGRLGG